MRKRRTLRRPPLSIKYLLRVLRNVEAKPVLGG